MSKLHKIVCMYINCARWPWLSPPLTTLQKKSLLLLISFSICL